jgi:hypothetical protein
LRLEALAEGDHVSIMLPIATVLWPHQVNGIAAVIAAILSGERRICLTSPTGGGKTSMICHLIEWALDNGWYVVLYTNRKLLIEQLSRVLAQHNIEFGVRASGHQDNRHLPIQISSLPTENQRVLKTGRWEVHGNGQKTLAIVDETHLNKSKTAQEILAQHHAAGGGCLGVTATPIGLGHLYARLIVAGTLAELRKCGAIVWASHVGPDEPDMRNFRPSVKTGDYSENQIRKAIMHKRIWGRVLENYSRRNPDPDQRYFLPLG